MGLHSEVSSPSQMPIAPFTGKTRPCVILLKWKSSVVLLQSKSPMAPYHTQNKIPISNYDLGDPLFPPNLPAPPFLRCSLPPSLCSTPHAPVLAVIWAFKLAALSAWGAPLAPVPSVLRPSALMSRRLKTFPNFATHFHRPQPQELGSAGPLCFLLPH